MKLSSPCRPALVLVLAALLALPGHAAHPQGTLPEIIDPPFVFDGPVPSTAPVEPQWFADAAFVGDSRTEALATAGLFSPRLRLTQVGLSVRTARAEEGFVVDGSRLPLTQALAQSGCRKVYLMLGASEASWMSGEEFYRDYSALITDLRTCLPNVQIYLQTLIPVTISRATARKPDNDQIAAFSALIRRLARERQVYLVDLAPLFTQSNGALSPDLTTDGYLLNSQGNALWSTYLMEHTVAN